jgi:hypothetical protein
MFLALAQEFVRALAAAPAPPRGEHRVFLVHPAQLSRWLDDAWLSQAVAPLPPGLPGPGAPPPPFLGDPAIVGTFDLPTTLPLPAGRLPFLGLNGSGIVPPDPDTFTAGQTPGNQGLLWHHLIYAYLIESTGALEIFAEIVRRLVVGENLGSLRLDAARWLRATEELFFRNPPLYSVTGVTSEMRPHARVARRNAYWRMFGFDLPHPIPTRWPGAGTDQGWKADVGAGTNADFRAKWTDLLRQIWLGLEYATNTTGSNPTDVAYIRLLIETVRDMMANRRRGGLLAREEFAYVTTLSWFHLTLLSDTPIIEDLKANASAEADRLALLGERVGMSPAARSRELFDLAERTSRFLRAIELGLFPDDQSVEALYLGNTPLVAEMRAIVNNWQSATGERIKDRPTGTLVPAAAQPLRVPAPQPPVLTPASPNGAPR